MGKDSTGKQAFNVEGSRFLINRRLHQKVQGESNYSLAFDCNSEANGTHGEMEDIKPLFSKRYESLNVVKDRSNREGFKLLRNFTSHTPPQGFPQINMTCSNQR